MKHQGNREPRTIAAESRTDQVPAQPDAPSDALTGIVGDASSSVTRSGDDSRRRGWFWHWNHIVTQYSPLIGLKGVGLLNSYTVWTDRREESPHRGFAFPSQQSEADFYGEDRAELMTINKILVALDLIEIRKEMVFRVDDRGRRWKVPHNFYRVKDQGEGLTLTTQAVRRVVELADRDRTVYRYLRRLFSPRFSPIDSDNVWHQILEDLKPTEAWQRLAAKTERDETRASARSRAGHAARRGNDSTTVFSLPERGDNAAPAPTVGDSANDSPTVHNDSFGGDDQTSVAPTNHGSAISVEPGNNGLDDSDKSFVEPGNTAGVTNVGPGNSTYYQEITTTTTTESVADLVTEPLAETEATVIDSRTDSTVRALDFRTPPDTGRDEDLAIRRFEEANERSSTIAERRLLRNLAAQFDETAGPSSSGWSWVADAIDEAVSAGSRFVAPKRIREILARWQAEGRDGSFATNEQLVDHVAQNPVTPVTQKRRSERTVPASGDHVSVATGVPPAPFSIEECGLTNRQVWNSVLSELHASPVFGRAGAETWLRDTHIIGRTHDRSVVVGVSNALALRRLEGHYLNTITDVVSRVMGCAVTVEIADYRTWHGDTGKDTGSEDVAI